MRIFYSPARGDPMLLDREDALHAFARELATFAAGDRVVVAFAADTSGSPEPYAGFLGGLRVRRAGGGHAECHLEADGWLELRATDADLKELAERIARVDDGDHTHLYARPVSLIFEADDDWPGFDEG